MGLSDHVTRLRRWATARAEPAEVDDRPPAPELPDSDAVLRAVGAKLSASERVALTVSCRDCDALPKVDGAGECHEVDGVRTQRMFNGIEVPEDGYVGGWMTDLIRQLRGHHEPQEELVFAAIMDRLGAEAAEDGRRRTLVELGCYWAFYSAWFVRDLPGGRALACEPDPDHLDVGRATAALNGLDITFEQCASGGADGEIVTLPAPEGGTRQVAVRTVPSLMADHDIDVIDVLHMDIQGYELDVLASCREAIAEGRVRFLVVSTHHHTLSGEPDLHARVLDLVTELGGHVIAEHTVLESCSGDGLIVASFHPADADLVVPVSRLRGTGALFPTAEAELARVRDAYDRLHHEYRALRAGVTRGVTEPPTP